MNNVDDELLQLMRRLPPAQPSPDLLPSVHRRVARRRVARYAAAGTATLLVVAGTAGAVLAFGHGSHRATVRVVAPSTAVVPWVNQPATPPPPPAPPTPPPPLYPACTAAQLTGGSVPGGAAAGNLLSVVVLTNTSTSPCSLTGYPASLVGVHADGSRTTLSPFHGSMFDGQFAWPANLRPGGSGRLGIATADGCQAAQVPGAFSNPAVTYPAEIVGLPGGGTVRATARFNASCGVGVTTFGAPQPSQASAGSYPGLQVTANVPPTMVAGSTLQYTVTLTNTGNQPVRLDPCPVYTEGLYTTAPHVRSYRLNCSTVQSIAAGGSATYAMRIRVPTGHSGAAKFGWSIPNSASAFAGTVVTITTGPSATPTR